MVKQVRRFALAGMLGMGLVVATAPKAQAVDIIGRYNFTLGNVKVTFGFIDWTTDPGAAQSTPPISGALSYGTYDVSTAAATRSGVFLGPEFSALGLGAAGSSPCPANPLCAPERIQDMTDPVTQGGDARNVPVGVGNTPNFFILAEQPTWHFTETFLTPGTAGLPFEITQVGSDLSITMHLSGFAFDTNGGAITNWTAVISAQYNNLTAAQLEAQVLAGTLPINSWSGTFEAVGAGVPEPATLLTFGTGALAAAIRRRRRMK
jgi:PEP-CTERM motif